MTYNKVVVSIICPVLRWFVMQQYITRQQCLCVSNPALLSLCFLKRLCEMIFMVPSCSSTLQLCPLSTWDHSPPSPLEQWPLFWSEQGPLPSGWLSLGKIPPYYGRPGVSSFMILGSQQWAIEGPGQSAQLRVGTAIENHGKCCMGLFQFCEQASTHLNEGKLLKHLRANVPTNKPP